MTVNELRDAISEHEGDEIVYVRNENGTLAPVVSVRVGGGTSYRPDGVELRSDPVRDFVENSGYLLPLEYAGRP